MEETQTQEQNPLVSIVIPNFNALTLIRRSVETALNTDYPNFEVIVVDDHSTDGSVELIERSFSNNPRLRIIKNSERLGPSATRNKGISAAMGRYIAFIETDMEVHPDWLSEALKVFKDDRAIGAVQSLGLDLNKRDRVIAMGVYVVPHVAGWVINRSFGKHVKEVNSYSEDVCAGAVGLVVKREVIANVGDFDQELEHKVDDVDFCLRIWLGGYKIVTAPKSIVYHYACKPWSVQRKTLSRLQSEFHMNKVFRVMIKNYEFQNLVKYLPWAIAITSLRAFLNLIRGDLMPLIGLFKAALWTFKTLSSTLIERYKIQNFIRRFPDDYIMRKIMVKNLRAYMSYVKSVEPTIKAHFR